MTYLYTFLTTVFLFASFTLSAQTVNIFKWEWSIPEEQTDCLVDANISDLYYDFRELLKDSLPYHRILARNRNVDPFVADMVGNKRYDEYSIFVYGICEDTLFGLRAYLFDHNVNKLVNEVSVSTLDTFDIRDFPSVLYNRMNEDGFLTHNGDLTAISSRRFDACFEERKLNYYYEKHIEYVEAKGEVEVPRIRGKSPKRLIDGINIFLEAENVVYLDSMWYIINSGDMGNGTRRMKRYKAKYPHLFSLMNAVVIFERYRNSSLKVQNSMAKLMEEIEMTLLTDDTPISDKERDILERLDINYLELIERVGKGIRYVRNCRNVFTTPLPPEKMMGMFEQILANEDISSLLDPDDRGENGFDCYNLKLEARDRSNSLRDSLQKAYRREMFVGDSLVSVGQAALAVQHYENANGNISNQSFLVEVKQEYALQELSRPAKIEAEIYAMIRRELREVASTSAQIMNSFDVSMYNGQIILDVRQDSNLINSWLTEVNYELGSYSSRYDQQIEQKMAEIINAVFEKYGYAIQRLNLRYIGSSDASSFLNSGKLKVKEKRYRNLPNDRVQENAVLNSRMVLNYGSKKLYDLAPQSFDYNQLLNLKATRSETVLRQSLFEDHARLPMKEDYAKNLLLAYLRCKKRHDQIMDRIDPDMISKDIITSTIRCEVSPEKGYNHRSVQTKISITLKSAQELALRER